MNYSKRKMEDFQNLVKCVIFKLSIDNLRIEVYYYSYPKCYS